MELILLKGKDDAGKTNTAACVYNILVKEKAFVKKLELKNNLLNFGEIGWDFRSELELENKIIHIISEGDTKIFFRENIFKYKQNDNVDFLVICVRTEEKEENKVEEKLEEKDKSKKPLYDFVLNEFKNYHIKEFTPEYVENADDCKGIIEAKKRTAQEIAKYIIDEISKQNEN